MMKILKRNQLIILVISLMLITAGYLNFTADNLNTVEATSIDKVAELGDATLVSSTWTEENKIEAENTILESNLEVEQTGTETNDNSYYTSSKLERENMYSQMLETYQQIYNNSSSTEQQKTNALNEIAKIQETKNGIMIAENLISAKGFHNVVIFVNTNSVSIIIGGEELSQEQIAQIQNIVSRELEVTADIIHISTK